MILGAEVPQWGPPPGSLQALTHRLFQEASHQPVLRVYTGAGDIATDFPGCRMHQCQGFYCKSLATLGYTRKPRGADSSDKELGGSDDICTLNTQLRSTWKGTGNRAGLRTDAPFCVLRAPETLAMPSAGIS